MDEKRFDDDARRMPNMLRGEFIVRDDLGVSETCEDKWENESSRDRGVGVGVMF